MEPPTPLEGSGLGLFGLREPPFINRTTESQWLWKQLQTAVENRTHRIALVSGDGGTGKTRLAEWVARRAHELSGAKIIDVYHSRKPSQMSGIRAALEHVFRTFDLPRGRVYRRVLNYLKTHASNTSNWEYDLEKKAAALTEYLRPTREGERDVEGPSYRFSNVEQKHSYICRLLEIMTARRPVVVFLDDLQWGEKTLEWLSYLADSEQQLESLLVVGTIRRDLLTATDEARQMLGRLQSLKQTSRIELSPLNREHQLDLLDHLLPLDRDVAQRLAKRTEGHPLFASQLLGHWIDLDLVEFGEHGFEISNEADAGLPADLQELWIERIERILDDFPSQRDNIFKALDVAAVLGRTVERSEWKSVLNNIEGVTKPPSNALTALTESGLIEKDRRSLSFSHQLLLDSLTQRLKEQDRWSTYNRRCAETLEEKSESAMPGLRQRIAEHWIEGNRPEKSIAPLLAESRLYGRRGNLKASHRMKGKLNRIMQQVDVPENDERRLDKNIEHGAILANQGELSEAYELLMETWERTKNSPRRRARIVEQLARVESRRSNWNEARSWVERGLKLISRSEKPGLASRLYRRLVKICFWEEKLVDAKDWASKAIEAARETDGNFGEVESGGCNCCGAR
jgi:ABC-type molybdenum transport system ATPase subunit/photorepair protein PhrA